MQHSQGKLKHYRDKDGAEIDAVAINKEGEIGFIEIKLGGQEAIKQGLRSLKRVEKKSLLVAIKGRSSKWLSPQ